MIVWHYDCALHVSITPDAAVFSRFTYVLVTDYDLVSAVPRLVLGLHATSAIWSKLVLPGQRSDP